MNYGKNINWNTGYIKFNGVWCFTVQLENADKIKKLVCQIYYNINLNIQRHEHNVFIMKILHRTAPFILVLGKHNFDVHNHNKVWRK